jgi:hypothetical protein
MISTVSREVRTKANEDAPARTRKYDAVPAWPRIVASNAYESFVSFRSVSFSDVILIDDP